MKYIYFGKRCREGGSPLKVLIRVIIIAAVFFSISIYFNFGEKSQKNKVLNGEKNITQKEDPETTSSGGSLQSGSKLAMPKEGLAGIIGQDTKDIIKTFGNPIRKDMSAYGYEWWIYNQNQENYIQIGVQGSKAVTAYGTGGQVNVAPFKIGQPINEIFSKVTMPSSINIQQNGTTYRFELSEDDMNTRPIVKLGNIYAQIYLDKFTGSVSSVRYLDSQTLVSQRPYELIYRGELAQPKEPDENHWRMIEEGNERQIYDLTNIIRSRFELNTLEGLPDVSQVAFLHSKDMMTDEYFSHTSPTKGELKDRLKDGHITYTIAGENIAANYVDGIEAVEGWLNSKGHRDSLLNDEYTGIGVGVYRKYYTQDFIR
ncbi:CAP domain-containing protein [Peribacillus kribbensis]|uniref:CAP domain-containing protein n=1 Tax=Peribacillus kribbensis TaxID=356658 RepID=UPI0004097780|nr:CAP domain-containing protein [Peribacillus kribbensis]